MKCFSSARLLFFWKLNMICMLNYSTSKITKQLALQRVVRAIHLIEFYILLKLKFLLSVKPKCLNSGVDLCTWQISAKTFGFLRAEAIQLFSLHIKTLYIQLQTNNEREFKQRWKIIFNACYSSFFSFFSFFFPPNFCSFFPSLYLTSSIKTAPVLIKYEILM